MTQDYPKPITPSQELVRQWWVDAQKNLSPDVVCWVNNIAARAAQWGADQELDACCEVLNNLNDGYWSKELRAARCLEPPTLNSIALQMLNTIERDAHYLPEITDTIRRALEQLDG